ncbi:MAG TPA: glycosyltransferase, partial [Isosphaeraceae bacterium]|nr:glycosyltransferase [Isosphaeraceae bacterium]
MLLSLIITSALFAFVPALLFRANKRAYAPAPCPPAGQEFPPVSVLIPARNEENAIGDAVRAALQNQGIELEVVVLD